MELTARQQLLVRINGKYVSNPKDKELDAALKRLADALIASLHGPHPEGGVLAVIGDSGAGKTWMLERALQDSHVIQSMGLLKMIMPSPCTPGNFAREILRLLDFEVMQDRVMDYRLWNLARKHAELSSIRFIWADEEQHSSVKQDERKRLSDSIKNFVQQRHWPVSFILSGVAELRTFMGDFRQLERRSRTIDLAPLSSPEDHDLFDGLFQGLVHSAAGMSVSPGVATDDFRARIIHASDGQFGSVIESVRAAIMEAHDHGRGTVEIADFAAQYAGQRGCLPEQNVFLVPRWQEVVPANSRRRADLPAPDDDNNAKGKAR